MKVSHYSPDSTDCKPASRMLDGEVCVVFSTRFSTSETNMPKPGDILICYAGVMGVLGKSLHLIYHVDKELISVRPLHKGEQIVLEGE